MPETIDLLGLDDPLVDLSIAAPTATPNPTTSIPMGAGDVAVGDGSEIFDPAGGELVDRQDVDGLLKAYQRIVVLEAKLKAAKDEIRKSCLVLTEGKAKTRRLQGREMKAKVTMPDDSWDKKKLGEIWERWPEFRDQALKQKVETQVKVVEFKKLLETSGVPELEAFRNALAQANLGQIGLPTVSIEEK